MSNRTIFFVAWAVFALMLIAVGSGPIVGAVFGVIPAIVAAIVFRVARGSSSTPANAHVAQGQPPLAATYASDNVALDVPGRKLWLRDISGRQVIVGLDEVAAWEHTWTDTTNGWGKRFRIRNELAFRLRQLDVPMVRVRFQRHSDAFNGNQNFAEAEEWQARLTTIING